MSGVRCRGFVGLCVAVPLLLVMTAAGASAQSDAQPTFSAHGSVQQVYVTGLGSGAEMSLVNRHGQTIATQRANGLGACSFAMCRPGTDTASARQAEGCNRIR